LLVESEGSDFVHLAKVRNSLQGEHDIASDMI
jgi:hypothetical protein